MAILLTGNSYAFAPVDTSLVKRKLLTGMIAAEGVTALASLGGLYVLWYKDYPQSSFHFFNDNNEWLQTDKLSHSASAYNISRISYDLFRWPGVEKKKAAWYGGATGFTYLAVIEFLDGFSSEWGASPGDLVANTLGSAAFVSQQLVWDEQRILLKWSCHTSKYAQYRPNILGRNLPERIIKDYNGQTYWLSVNIHSFLNDNSEFPKWLNVAFGYGADGMLGAKTNPAQINGYPLPSFDRTRRYFLSLDLDLTRIKTRSKVLNSVFNLFGFLKIPFPAIEYNSGNKWVIHGVYF